MDSDKWRAVPKVELHCHLELCIRPATLKEELKRHNVQLPFQTEEEFNSYFYCTSQQKNLLEALTIIDHQAIIFRDKTTLSRVAKEAVIDKFNEGVKLVELRYAPTFIKHVGGVNMSYEDIHEALVSGLQAGISGCREQDPDFYAGLICIAISAYGRKTVEDTVEFLLAHRSDFIGFDIAGDERALIQQKDLVDRVHEAGISITLHCGEQPTTESVGNMQIAIEHLHAERIGHGVNVRLRQDVYNLVKETQTHLELCPVSNVYTNAVDKMENHPIKKYLDDGLNVSINTDDPTGFCTDNNQQFQVLHETLHMNAADLFRLARNALKSSFAPKSVKDRIYQRYFTEEAEKSVIANL